MNFPEIVDIALPGERKLIRGLEMPVTSFEKSHKLPLPA
jgi:hypothetical protein